MKSEYRDQRHSTRRGNLFVAAAALVLSCVLCCGCLRPPSTNDTKSSGSTSTESVPHPADYYEGYWLCSGYGIDGKTVSFSDLSPEQRGSFPYLVLELGRSGGTLSQVSNGDGEYRMLFGGDSRATSGGIRLINEEGGLDLALADEFLVLTPDAAASLEASVNEMGLYLDYRLPQGNATYYFVRTASDSQLQVVTYGFDGITLDVPVDVAYTLDGVTPESSDNGRISTYGASYRRYGPRMDFSSWPTEATSMAEVIDEAEGQGYSSEHPEEFTEYEGVLYHLHHNEELNYSRLGFVAGGKLYEIVFSYDDEDVVDYSDYCEHFFTSIRFAGEDLAAEQSDGVPSGAIPWQDAAQHVGETVTVYGPVAEIDYASTSDGQPTFIDLGAAYPDPNRVTMVIWGEDRGNFPDAPEALYAGKTLYVTGEIYLYRGVCNIEVTSPSQVKVL